MNYLSFISLFTLTYCVYLILIQKKPVIAIIDNIPITVFLLYAHLYSNGSMPWAGAFQVASIFALGAISIQWHEGIIFDRMRLGLNYFLILGGLAFLLHLPTILKWYAATKGGPLFGCILFVGIITAVSTKSGFIGVDQGNREMRTYASFLLFAATIIALVWTVKADAEGILWAVALPYLMLVFVRNQIVDHLFR